MFVVKIKYVKRSACGFPSSLSSCNLRGIMDTTGAFSRNKFSISKLKKPIILTRRFALLWVAPSFSVFALDRRYWIFNRFAEGTHIRNEESYLLWRHNCCRRACLTFDVGIVLKKIITEMDCRAVWNFYFIRWLCKGLFQCSFIKECLSAKSKRWFKYLTGILLCKLWNT